MALVKSLDEIENLIPEPDYRLYGSNITEVSSRDVINYPLFAFTVNRKANIVVSMYRVLFMLVKRFNKFYLMVTDYYKDSENNHTGDYITLTEPKDRHLEKTDWPFTIDEIGLRLDSTCYDRNMIYFGTNVEDVNEVKKMVKARKEKKIVTLEPVVV